MDKDQTLKNPNTKGHLSPKLYALEYRRGQQLASRAATEQWDRHPWAWWMARGNSGREGRRQPAVRSPEENWAAPSPAVRTAEVTFSSPRAVAYTSFSSLTFALVFSEHWGGERTRPQVKDAQLKIPPKLSGCAPWALGSQPPSFDAHPHQNEQHEPLLAGQRSHGSPEPDKNLLPYRETISEARKELYSWI